MINNDNKFSIEPTKEECEMIELALTNLRAEEWLLLCDLIDFDTSIKYFDKVLSFKGGIGGYKLIDFDYTKNETRTITVIHNTNRSELAYGVAKLIVSMCDHGFKVNTVDTCYIKILDKKEREYYIINYSLGVVTI